MASTIKVTLSLAALTLAMSLPGSIAAQATSNMSTGENGNQNAGSMNSGNSMNAGKSANSTGSMDSSGNMGAQVASQMVPARASLDRTLNAKDARPGQVFEAKLPGTVHLKDGVELPRGTVLMGKVAQDDMGQQGKAKLALCINEAKLKDGKIIPVKATIVGIYPPDTVNVQAEAVAPGDQTPNPWTPGTQQVDELDALSGVDLHSRIGSNNSGVLVSTKKNDIKISAGTELALAIAGSNQSQMQNNANSNGSGSY